MRSIIALSLIAGASALAPDTAKTLSICKSTAADSERDPERETERKTSASWEKEE